MRSKDSALHGNMHGDQAVPSEASRLPKAARRVARSAINSAEAIVAQGPG